MLPPLTELRIFADQMRQLSSAAHIFANCQGELKLVVHDASISGEAQWSELTHPQLSGMFVADMWKTCKVIVEI